MKDYLDVSKCMWMSDFTVSTNIAIAYEYL